MPEKVISENRKYTRYAHTQAESRYLGNKGLRPVVSSNVSAVGLDGETLIVRFHGGATYGYPQSGNRYEDMLNAPSKGKFVWRELRKTGVPYYRMGNVNIENDIESRDMIVGLLTPLEEIFILSTLVTQTDLINSGIIANLIFAQDINAGIKPVA